MTQDDPTPPNSLNDKREGAHPSEASSGILSTINPSVFFPAAISLVALLLFAVLTPQHAIDLFQAIKGSILTNFSWLYIFTVTFLFGFWP